MKKSFIIASLAIGALFLQGCKKEMIHLFDTLPTEGNANLKIVHASSYSTNYTVHLKINETRVSNNISNSTAFPGGGLNVGGSNSPWYLSLKPGGAKISLAMPKTGTSDDSVVLYSNTLTLDANKFYSAYLTDTGNKTQTVLITENRAPVLTNDTRFKFVNLMPNQAALDLYFAGNLVAGNIPYKGASVEFTLPTGSIGQWAIRAAGSAPASTAIATYPVLATATHTIPDKRIMTLFSRGYSGSSGNRAPALSLLYN
jgi:hypothetical protein